MESVLIVTAGTTTGAVLTALAYKFIRPYFGVTVNCWFCNTNSKVPYRRLNCFVCPHCKQYNGFDESGDYNCDLPAQYCDTLNSPSSRAAAHQQRQKESNGSHEQSAGLCQTCNVYQAMKVKALSEFEPSHPDKFDEEVEIYKRRLERLYGALCANCNGKLKRVIKEQDSWLKPKLVNWRLQQTKLMKEFLGPLQRTFSRRQMVFSAFFRLLSIVLLTCLLFSMHYSGAIEKTFLAHFVNFAAQHFNNSFASPQTKATSFSSDDWEQNIWLISTVGQHEAGTCALLMFFLLLVVHCSPVVQKIDAIQCLVTVLLLILEVLLHHSLVPHAYISYLADFKLVLFSTIFLSSICGLLYKPELSSKSQDAKRYFSCRSKKHQTDDDIMGFSDESGSESPHALTATHILTKPTLLNSGFDHVLPRSSEGFSGPSVSASGSHLSLGSALRSPSAPQGPVVNTATVNPFLVKQSQPLGAAYNRGGGFVYGESDLHNSSFRLRQSYLGDSLNASINSLKIGPETLPKSSNNNKKDLNSFCAQGTSFPIIDNNFGMTLRSHVTAGGNRRPSAIAQSSWVAGGYWGSPNKSPRFSSVHEAPKIAHNHNENRESSPLISRMIGANQPSRSSSQSSGFVSHSSGSLQPNLSGSTRESLSTGPSIMLGTDRASHASETTFVWNYESCETSTQCSQSGADEDDRHVTPSSSACSVNGSLDEYSNTLKSPRLRSPRHDLQAMRALSRMSSHDISDDDLSLLGVDSQPEVLLRSKGIACTNSATGWHRSSLVAFILGMSIMANAILILVMCDLNIIRFA